MRQLLPCWYMLCDYSGGAQARVCRQLTRRSWKARASWRGAAGASRIVARGSTPRSVLSWQSALHAISQSISLRLEYLRCLTCGNQVCGASGAQYEVQSVSPTCLRKGATAAPGPDMCLRYKLLRFRRTLPLLLGCPVHEYTLQRRHLASASPPAERAAGCRDWTAPRRRAHRQDRPLETSLRGWIDHCRGPQRRRLSSLSSQMGGVTGCDEGLTHLLRTALG